MVQQLSEELEDSRADVQKYKRQLQRSEQLVGKLEDELSQVKTDKRRRSDVIQAEDFKEEIDRCVTECVCVCVCVCACDVCVCV